MQIIFLPKLATILLCFIVWPLFQIAAAVICIKLPDRFFLHSSFFYRSHHWEKSGEIYQQWFKVHWWKKFLPDAGALIKDGFKKKSLESFSKSNLDQFLLESCRAEMTHWLAILPFWVFGLFAPIKVIFLMLIYALAVNMPCIIAQRYNRPRIIRVSERMGLKRKF